MITGTTAGKPMISTFMLQSLLAGIGLSFITSPMGCFLVWRRMSFFGDALSHSALLGVVLGLMLGINLHWGVLIVCIGITLLLAFVDDRGGLPSDTWLSITSYGALAIGMILINKMPSLRIDPSSYLFGDILTLQSQDFFWIFGCAVLVVGFTALQWQPLLLSTLDEGLAKAEGVSLTPLKLGFMIILALTVAVSLKFIGVLLVPALLVIPPATAKKYASTPEQMVFYAWVFTVIGITGGLALSLFFNLATGASIILVNLVIFIVSQILCTRT